MSLLTQLAHLWHQPDRFASMTDYIAARRLHSFARISMGVAVLGFTVIGLAMLASYSGPASDITRTVSLIGNGVTLLIGVFWLLRWPTQRQSYWIVAGIGCAITLQSFAVSNPWVALSGAGAFAFLAGYVATLHGARALVAVVAVATVVIVVAGVRLGAATDPIVATMLTVSLIGNTVLLPLLLITLIPVMQLDAQNSDVDSLTQLLNRRGFDKALDRLVCTFDADAVVTVNVMLIDLDDFKHLNDTEGHAVGDDVLRHVGATLLGSEGQLRGRIGGEEFVVVLVGTPDAALDLAERHRSGIADNRWGITASIGAACASTRVGGRSTESDLVVVVRALMNSADRQMYRAKRDGGNRVRQADSSQSEPTTSSPDCPRDPHASTRRPADGRSPRGRARSPVSRTAP